MPSVAVVAGAGPGLGSAVCRALGQKGYIVAVLARTKSSIQDVAEQIKKAGGQAEGFECDLTKPDSIRSAFQAIQKRYKEPLRVSVFNAGAPFAFKSALDVTEEECTFALNLNGVGALVFAQESLKAMFAHEATDSKDTSTMIFSGATASLRGGAKFAGYAPAKFALRALAQSLAREFGPRGVHVATCNIDGLINTPKAKERFGEGKEGERLEPDDIAQTYMALVDQPRSCWTHEIDVRPALEKW